MADRTPEAIAAREICRETCAYRGEPPCWDERHFPGAPWPNPECDEPGCDALGRAVAAILRGEKADG